MDQQPAPSRVVERRATPRIPLAVRVRVTDRDEIAVELHARDLSATGVFIFTPRPLAVGTAVGLEIEPEGLRSIPIRGEVVRTQIVQDLAGGMGLSGMAIRFVDIAAEDRDLLEALVRAVETALRSARGLNPGARR